MPKPVISPTDIDLTVQKNFTAIKEVLCGGMGLDNFQYQVIEGITSETQDQEKKFIHSCTPQPCGWLPLAGDVYVQAIDSKTIDVRSTKRSVAFKLLLIRGPQVTEEVAVNPSDYQDTEDVINVVVGNDGSDDEGTSSGTTVDIVRNQCIISGSSSIIVNSVATDASYIYITFNGTVGNGDIYRIKKSDGTTSRLNVGASPIGPLYFDGTNLWTVQINTANPTAYKISPSTFTVTTSYANCGDAGYFRCACLYVNTTHIYTGGRSTLGADRVCFFRRAISGGATSEVTVAVTSSATNARGVDMVTDGTRAFLIGQGMASENIMMTTTMSNFNNADAVTYTYGSADGRFFSRCALYGDDLYLLYMRTHVAGSTVRTGDNGCALVVFNTQSNTFTSEIPITCGQLYPTDRGGLMNHNFFIDDDGYGWLVNSSGSLIEVIKVDLSTGNQVVQMYPVSFLAGSLPSVPSVWNNVLVQEYDTGRPLIVRPGPNSIYFNPTNLAS